MLWIQNHLKTMHHYRKSHYRISSILGQERGHHFNKRSKYQQSKIYLKAIPSQECHWWYRNYVCLWGHQTSLWQIPKKIYLGNERFVLSHGFRGSIPSWSYHGGQEADKQNAWASNISLPSPFISSRLPVCTHEALPTLVDSLCKCTHRHSKRCTLIVS